MALAASYRSRFAGDRAALAADSIIGLLERLGDLGPMIVSYLAVPLMLMMAGSGLALGYIVAKWNGDPKTHMLLRLIDESQREGT